MKYKIGEKLWVLTSEKKKGDPIEKLLTSVKLPFAVEVITDISDRNGPWYKVVTVDRSLMRRGIGHLNYREDELFESCSFIDDGLFDL